MTPTTANHLGRLDLDRRAFVRLLALGSGAAIIGCTGSEDAVSSRRQIPEPTNALVTRWWADEHSFGSYSYLGIDTREEDRSLLAAPLGRRVFFAGEATSSRYPSTVHGALLSGYHAADAIMSMAEPGAKIGVVGAGVSALAGARQLVDAGFNVRLWESRDRMGGRVHTDATLGYPVDLGASWIHGVTGNPMTEIADSIGAPLVRTDYDSVVVYNRDGSVNERDVWTGTYRAVQGAKQRGVSLAEAVADRKTNRDEEVVRGIDFAVVAAYEHEYAADIEELSALAPHEGEEFPGPDVLLPNGYLNLLDTMTADLDVQLSTRVDGIDWGGECVRLLTSTGTAPRSEVEVEVEHVLVTVPLGVLKAGRIAFEPALPRDKQGAIDRLGMGTLDKVVLEFPERFWDRSAETIGFIAEDRGHWAQWYDLSDITGHPTIFCFHAGSVARLMEGKSDSDIVDEAMVVLRTIYEH